MKQKPRFNVSLFRVQSIICPVICGSNIYMKFDLNFQEEEQMHSTEIGQ